MPQRLTNKHGNILEFLLTKNRDKKAAKRFFKKMLGNNHVPNPRVINVDKNKAYPPAVDELKKEKLIAKRCKLRQIKYLNNIVEQSHRFIKKLVKNNQWFQPFKTAQKTITDYQIMNIIRHGQVRYTKNCDILAQKKFIENLFGIGI